MQSNFVFLQNDFPVLYQIGIIAEKYLYTDSNVCLIKLGMFGETVVNLILQLDKISAPQTGIRGGIFVSTIKIENLSF